MLAGLQTPNWQFLYSSRSYVELAARLTGCTDTQLMVLGCRGSDAVETAMKMALQTTAAIGDSRARALLASTVVITGPA